MVRIQQGDIVRCIDSEYYLTQGMRYLVEGVDGEEFLAIRDDNGDLGKYYRSRFKLCPLSSGMSGADEYEEVMACQEAMRDA